MNLRRSWHIFVSLQGTGDGPNSLKRRREPGVVTVPRITLDRARTAFVSCYFQGALDSNSTLPMTAARLTSGLMIYAIRGALPCCG